MAIEATKIYVKHKEIFDDQMNKFISERPLRDDLRSLKVTASPQESMKINDVQGSCMILAGAGMCNAGRILHHLKHNLWREEAHILIVGFQGHGSLGRRLVEGQKMVSIHGEKVIVRAKVHTMGGFSAHAGQKDLLAWFAAVAPSKPRLILTHGEDKARRALSAELRKRFSTSSYLPRMGEIIAL
jgi:metallo-beta-lactamase family protein